MKKRLSAGLKFLVVYGTLLLLTDTDTLEQASLLFIGLMSLVYLKNKIWCKKSSAGKCPLSCGGCD